MASNTTSHTIGGGAIPANERVWYFIDTDGNQRGPISPSDITEMVLDREIQYQTLGSDNQKSTRVVEEKRDEREDGRGQIREAQSQCVYDCLLFHVH